MTAMTSAAMAIVRVFTVFAPLRPAAVVGSVADPGDSPALPPPGRVPGAHDHIDLRAPVHLTRQEPHLHQV
jgi:hypothetical protein